MLPSPWGDLGDLYRFVSDWDVDKDGRPDDAADEWWANDVGGRADPSDATIDGFMEGAIEVWQEVKQHV